MASIYADQVIRSKLAPMDETATATLVKEIKVIGTKARFVLWPFGTEQDVSILKEWDLWGPLFILIGLTAIQTAEHGVSKANEIFGVLYQLYFGGAAVVATNALLVRSDGSVGLMASVLGYSTAPFLISAAVNVLLRSIITIWGVAGITLVCYFWAVKSASKLLEFNSKPNRRYLVLYPMYLFYAFFAAMLIIN